MPDGTDDGFIENRTFDELAIGETASLSHTVTQRDIDLFATVTGDVNPAHVDPAYAATDMFHHIIIQGMWGAGLISATLGTKLPGPGQYISDRTCASRHPVSIGDTITATVTVREKKPAKGDVVLDCVCTNQQGRDRDHRQRLRPGADREGARSSASRCPRCGSTVTTARSAMIARAADGIALATAVVYPGRCDLPARRAGRREGRADRSGPDRTGLAHPAGREGRRRRYRRPQADRRAGS